MVSATGDDVAENEQDVILYSDDDKSEIDAVVKKNNKRWKSLSPRVKLRILQEAHERAIAQKKRREPAHVKKRREYRRVSFCRRRDACHLSYVLTSFAPNLSSGMMMFFKKKQQQKKRASRVERPIPFDQRTPLAELDLETEMEGTVISLTNFGAYVDIGSECDGLLHISQLTRDFFVEHPRQVLTPGDQVTVMVRSVNPEKKKLHLTMLPKEQWQQDFDDEDDEERIPLDEIDIDDELWGQVKRVTDYGCYVELGAQVDGFLHFMDHPEFGANPGAPPSDFMHVDDRIRVWVSDVDMQKKRIKLTANRPTHLPGPRRDIY